MAIAPSPKTILSSLTANRGVNVSTEPTYFSTNHNHLHKVNGRTNQQYKNQFISTMDRNDRTSFSSIKESDSGIAQSFTTTKTSSLLRTASENEEAIDDDIVTPPEGMPGTPRRNHHSHMLHRYVCPCDGFQGWKRISLGGKLASKSFGDLQALGHRWEWVSVTATGPENTDRALVAKLERRFPAGQAPIERLPIELLGSIIDQLATDIPPNGFTARNIDLMSLMLTSRGIHSATLATLYKNITFPHSRIFRKFISFITERPALGTIVRRLDFSHFNPTGAGMTARERQSTLNLIPETLLQCIRLTPHLREFLAQEHIDNEIDSKVLKALLCDLPFLNALDLCACSSTSFRDAFTSVIEEFPCALPVALPITRLSLHECPVLPSTTFLALLPRMPKLTHLDVAHTRITDKALLCIPQTAKLTHLNLSKCSLLSSTTVLDFLTNHPAARTLVYLNLAMDIKSHEMLSAKDVSSLLPILPPTLRSLSLKGSKMSASHIPLLLPLTKHLQELGLGRNLELSDLCRLFSPDENLEPEEQAAWIPHTLHYLDVSDLSVSQLDLGFLLSIRCPVLTPRISAPLQVLEISSEVNKRLGRSPAVEKIGWCKKDAGRRYWLVRVIGVDALDSGARDWKWGACYWGMRKAPVARVEVGGMYGHYMFKR